jgi:hypothetical protein
MKHTDELEKTLNQLADIAEKIRAEARDYKGSVREDLEDKATLIEGCIDSIASDNGLDRCQAERCKRVGDLSMIEMFDRGLWLCERCFAEDARQERIRRSDEADYRRSKGF